jgi:uncharacterized protein with PIN domain
MLFHLDEHVDHAIARALRMRGIDVTTTTDANLAGAADEEHVEFGIRTGRVIFTQDADFVKLHRLGIAHAGIVYSSSHTRTICEVVRFLCLMHDCLTQEEMTGKVEFM